MVLIPNLQLSSTSCQTSTITTMGDGSPTSSSTRRIIISDQIDLSFSLLAAPLLSGVFCSPMEAPGPGLGGLVAVVHRDPSRSSGCPSPWQTAPIWISGC